MSQLAVQLAELALAHLPASLRADGDTAVVREAASRLSSTPRIGLEFALAGPSRPPDLAQQILQVNGGPGRLRALCKRRTADADWHGLVAFASCWDSGTLSGSIDEVWLEADAGSDRCPSVFLGFQGGLSANLGAAQRGIEQLCPARAQDFESLVGELRHAEALGFTIGNVVGIMLGRGSELRCTMRGLNGFRLAALAAERGLVTYEIGDLLDTLADYDLRLVLAFKDCLAATFGVEILPHQRVRGWETSLFALLAQAGLTDGGRANALGEWHGMIVPAAARADWPDALILADLGLEDGPPPALSCFVNHCKLSVSAEQLSAKAYLGILAS